MFSGKVDKREHVWPRSPAVEDDKCTRSHAQNRNVANTEGDKKKT
jgi:hypothetical protein